MSIIKLIFLGIIAIVIFNFFDNSNKEFDGVIMLPMDTKIVAFGDSITYGYGVSDEQNYPSQLSRLLQETVINAGVNGETTSEGLRRLPSVLEEHQPKILIIIHGGNDILRRQSLDRAKENIIQMIKLARKQNIHVVLVGVPRVEILALKTDKIYHEIARELNVPLDDSSLERILGDSSLKIDHIHPNAEGYTILANSLAELITSSYFPFESF